MATGQTRTVRRRVAQVIEPDDAGDVANRHRSLREARRHACGCLWQRDRLCGLQKQPGC